MTVSVGDDQTGPTYQDVDSTQTHANYGIYGFCIKPLPGDLAV